MLTDGQKKNIEDSIGHLLDFSSPKVEQALVDVFTAPLDQSTENEFITLRRCVEDPGSYLLNFDKVSVGNPLTIGEIQAYLLTLITNQLALTHHSTLLWDEQVSILLARLKTEKNWSSIFATTPIRPPVQNENNSAPFQLDVPEGSLFSGHTDLYFTHQGIIPVARITINYLPTESVTEEVYYGEMDSTKNEFADPKEEHRYRTELCAAGFIPVRNYVANRLIDYLKQKQPQQEEQLDWAIELETPDESIADPIVIYSDTEMMPIQEYGAWDNYIDHPVVSIMITNNYYFEQIKNKAIDIADIAKLTKQKAEHLTHPLIIKILQENLYELNFKTLIKYIPSMIAKLTHPSVQDLLNKNFLSLDFLKKLKPSSTKILIHPDYYQLILNNKIDVLNEIPKVNQANYCTLAKPFTVNLIKKGLSFKQALTLPKLDKTQCSLLITENMLQSVINGYILPSEVAKLSKKNIAMLKKHPTIFRWLEQKIIRIKDIISCKGNFYNLCDRAYARWLFTIAAHTLPMINGVSYDMTALLRELPDDIQACEVDETIFKKSVLHRLFSKIAHKIAEDTSVKRILDSVQIMINQTIASKNHDWPSLFNSIVESSPTLIQQLDLKAASLSSYTLFASDAATQRNEINWWKAFLNNFSTLLHFIDITPAPEPVLEQVKSEEKSPRFQMVG